MMVIRLDASMCGVAAKATERAIPPSRTSAAHSAKQAWSPVRSRSASIPPGWALRTRAVHAQDEREGVRHAALEQAVGDLPVDRVDRCRCQLDQNLPRSRSRVWE